MHNNENTERILPKLSVSERIKQELSKRWQLYVMLLLPFLYVLIFSYIPMVGLQIAFRDYTPLGGMWGSKWVGLKYFYRFFNNVQCWNYIKNTLAISIYTLVLGIPFPLLLALALDYARSKTLKKTVQLVSYLPHFLSTVIIVGMIYLLFGNRTGVVNNILQSAFGIKINFLGSHEYFRSLYVWSAVWQATGWGSILYIAALSGVDPQLHEAAIIDGASKLRRIWHIDLVCIRSTIVILIIMDLGRIFTVGFDKTYLMQNTTNLRVSEVLSTYTYKTGIGGNVPNYSYATAIGLITNVVNFTMTYIANKVAKKLSGSGLW